LDTFGERLRTERERLGLSQAAFGELGGVQKVAQINYEKGKRHPDAEYLAAIAAAGVDVLYVLTGQHSNAQTSAHMTGMTNRGHVATSQSNPPTSAGLTKNDRQHEVAELDEELMRRIVTMLTKTAMAAGRRWDGERLMLAAVDVYKFLVKEPPVDDEKLERVLKLVVDR